MTAMSARDRILARRGAIAANKSKGLKPYKFKSGITKFRIIPGPNGEPEFERKFGKTYLKSFDGKNFFGIGDRSVTFDEPTDVIRDLIFDAMRQSPDEDTKKHYQSMLAGTRYVFNALILDDKDQDPTQPVIIDVSEGAFDNIMSQFAVWAEIDESHDLASLERGHVFQVEKTGSGLDTRYTFNATPQAAPLGEKILEKAIDLDAWIASQFEGLEGKAVEFLARVNAAVGISTNASLASAAQQIAAPAANAPALAAPAATTPASSVSPAAVTREIEPEGEEASFEEIAAEAAKVASEPAPAAPEPTPTPAPTPAAEPTPEPAPAAAPAAPAEGSTGDPELDDILASLA